MKNKSCFHDRLNLPFISPMLKIQPWQLNQVPWIDEELIGNLGYGAPQSDTKRQKLLECILTRNSKLYLGKVYTEEKIKELNEEEVEKLFNNYEAKLSGQMVKSLGKSIINMYSMGAYSALGITNQDALSEGSFLAPLSDGIITSRHYLSEHNNNGRTSATGDNKNGEDEKIAE